MLKIGILQASRTMNIGTMMMAENFMWYVAKNLREVNFIASFYEKEAGEKRFKQALGEDFPIFAVEEIDLKQVFLNTIKATFSSKALHKAFPNKITDCDVIVVLGGDGFTESYGKIGVILELYRLYLFKAKLKKPVVLLGQTIGPFYGLLNILAISLLKKFDLITCRDPLSYEYLKKRNLNNIKLCADLAFLPLKKEKNITVEKDLVVMVPSRLIVRYIKPITYDEYIQFWADLVSYINEMGFKVVLLPHAVNDAFDDDRLIIRDIKLKLLNMNLSLKNINFINDILLPYEIRDSILNKSLITITGRMHAAISTLVKGGVPVNLSYGDKSLGILGKQFFLNELVIDLRKIKNVEELYKLTLYAIDYTLKNNNSLNQKINKNKHIIINLSIKNIKLFLNLLKNMFITNNL